MLPSLSRKFNVVEMQPMNQLIRVRRRSTFIAGGLATVVVVGAAVFVQQRVDQARRHRLNTLLGAELEKFPFELDNRRVLLLVKGGADVNLRNKRGQTPLYFAASDGDLAVVGELLRRGADPNSHSQTCSTPLIQAAHWWHTEVATALLAAGADPNQRNGSGFTPIRVASQYGLTELVGKLKAAGAVEQPTPPVMLQQPFEWAVRSIPASALRGASVAIVIQRLPAGSDGTMRVAIARTLNKSQQEPVAQWQVGITAFDTYVSGPVKGRWSYTARGVTSKRDIRLRDALLKAASPLWNASYLGSSFDTEVRERGSGYEVRFIPRGNEKKAAVTVALNHRFKVQSVNPALPPSL
jgi:hypothetical protein